jgi:hypothetical protein
MRSTSFALVFAALFAAPALCQSVWGVNGTSALAQQMTGPPAGPCFYPNGPMIGGFPYAVPFGCPTAGPYSTLPGGDITIDRVNDTVWVCDDLTITNYTKAGVPLNSFPTPQPFGIRALGWGRLGGLNLLWISNGFDFAAILPPAAPGCVLPTYVIPPTPVAFPGMVTDIDFDPLTGTLFMSNSNGLVSNQYVTGALGPYGLFAPGGCFGGALTGIAVNTPGCKTLYVTNSQTVAHINMGGGLAAPTFYTPNPCFSWAGAAPLSGLAHDCSPIRYGQGCDNTLFTIPTIGWSGQSLSPNPTFAITLGNADPGNAFLLVGLSAPCPAPFFMNCRLLVFPITTTIGPIFHAGPTVTLPASLPPGLPCPLSIYTQWVNMKTAGGVETTAGMEFSIGLP